MADTAQSGDQGSGESVDLVRVISALEAVVGSIDAGELTATGPERAYVVGAAATLRHMSDAGAGAGAGSVPA